MIKARLAAVHTIIFRGDLEITTCSHITHGLRRKMFCIVDRAIELQLLKLENLRDMRMLLGLLKFLDSRTRRQRYPAEIRKALALAVTDGSLHRAWLQCYACGALQNVAGLRRGTFWVTLSELIIGISGYGAPSVALSESGIVSCLCWKAVT